MKKLSTALLALSLASTVGALGCATADQGQGGYNPDSARIAREEQERLDKSRRHEKPPAMHIDNEMGVLDTEEVEATLQGHFEDVRNCYERAGKAQEYAGGRVLMRFLVAGDGSVSDVWVIESSLGNYPVERCLVGVGRGVVFKAPSGRKSTTFDYPVEFRSTREVAVLEIDGLKLEHDLETFLPQLASCGSLARQPTTAMMYIEPSGFPGSVGLAVEGALDEESGDCMVRAMRGWKMSAALPDHVLRATFQIPTIIASASASAEPPARRAVSSASGRKRRR